MFGPQEKLTKACYNILLLPSSLPRALMGKPIQVWTTGISLWDSFPHTPTTSPNLMTVPSPAHGLLDYSATLWLFSQSNNLTGTPERRLRALHHFSASQIVVVPRERKDEALTQSWGEEGVTGSVPHPGHISSCSILRVSIEQKG